MSRRPGNSVELMDQLGASLQLTQVNWRLAAGQLRQLRPGGATPQHHLIHDFSRIYQEDSKVN
jgi:hypothetical protein